MPPFIVIIPYACVQILSDDVYLDLHGGPVIKDNGRRWTFLRPCEHAHQFYGITTY